MKLFEVPGRDEPVLIRALGVLIDLALIALGTAMITIMTLNVLLRAVFDADLAWNVELGEFILVWATFIGGAAATRRGAHMRIGELVAAMPPRLAHGVEILTRLGVMALLVVLVWYGIIIAESQMDQQMTVLYWPVGLQYAALPVGSALTLVFVAHETWLIATGAPPEPAGDEVMAKVE